VTADSDAAARTQHRPSSMEKLRQVAQHMRSEGFSDTSIARALNVSLEFARRRLLDDGCDACE
jgi:hypothetical protein